MSTKNEQELKQEGWWMTILVVIPAIYFSCFSNLFFEGGFAEIVMSGILGGLGALIGAILYYLTKEKNTSFRLFVLVVLILFLLTITPFIS